MFKSKKTLALFALFVGVICYIVGKTEEENKPVSPRIIVEEQVSTNLVPLNPTLLHPYTESELRNEIDNRSMSNTYSITAIVYRARWNVSKDPVKYGRKWVEIQDRYKPTIKKSKLRAIIHLADYDQYNSRHQILNK